MKRRYTGLDAIKINMEGAILSASGDSCWQYVANRVGEDLTCSVTADSGKVGEWVDNNDPNFPVIGLPGC